MSGDLFAQRPRWSATPARVRSAVEEVCGARAVKVRDVSGGMSPGPAAILALANGRRVFVKAVSASAGAQSHRFYRREVVALEAMPAAAPTPRLIGSVEVGDWCALVMTVAEGSVAGPPWTADGVRLVEQACEQIAKLRAPTAVPRIGELLTDLDGWRRLRPDQLDAWERDHVKELADLADGWPEWTAGPALVHQDVRADNAVIDIAGGRAVLVDWSFGCAGAAWLDRARLAADIVGTGHHDGPAAALEAARNVLAGLPPGAIRFVAALAGMWRYRSTLPEPPGLPTLRTWQRTRALRVRHLLHRP
ncbi:aminoglycoside phosphotransferase family protein [Actinoplanes sp. LDG1-06]|uniref:Aminoglycoside phosphotransferase family protein n=1 Tax=Paractinoplanes ovalisporus TaxID=2810368 RepID=A0ABS2AUF9_9ACTN|nr:phosphotransferase [Actinoplanes ovalisporus]MBM2623512.1 aminoglycoside phosphotransferase family protein [Actinoplanes ovalisporus]